MRRAIHVWRRVCAKTLRHETTKCVWGITNSLILQEHRIKVISVEAPHRRGYRSPGKRIRAFSFAEDYICLLSFHNTSISLELEQWWHTNLLYDFIFAWIYHKTISPVSAPICSVSLLLPHVLLISLCNVAIPAPSASQSLLLYQSESIDSLIGHPLV